MDRAANKNLITTRKVLGIDPGYGRCGWAILEKWAYKEHLIEAGCFETPPTLDHQERIGLVGKHIASLITTHKPTDIALEKVFFYTNQKTALRVAEIRGVILHLAEELGKLPVYEFTPAQIKQAVCGYGKADKKQVQKMIMMLLKLKETPEPDDKADAIAVAIAGIQQTQAISNEL